MSLITVDSVVKSALIAEGKAQVDEMYWRFLHFALNGVKEMAYDVKATLKTVKVESENRIINYPSDMINWSRLFVIREGFIYCLMMNKDIPALDAYFEDKPETKTDRLRLSFSFYNFYDRDISTFRDYGKTYGIGGGVNTDGYYRPNDTMRRFELSQEVDSTQQIYLEYFSNGVECGNLTTIDERGREALEEYVKYQYYKMRKDLPRWRIAEQKKEWVASKAKYKIRRGSGSFKEIVAAIRRSSHLAPKY